MHILMTWKNCPRQQVVVIQFSSVQLLTCVRLFATPWTAARQASLSITNSWSLPKLMSIESMMPSNHLILCHPLSSCLQCFPASGSFQMSQLFASGGQSIGVLASVSVLPMNTQDWSPLGDHYLIFIELPYGDGCPLMSYEWNSSFSSFLPPPSWL